MTARVPRPGNYSEQAKSFDLTRGASPTVLTALRKYLGDPAGRSMLDAAGGTGNYAVPMADAGFQVVVLDANLGMLQAAAAKLGAGRTVAGDVQSPPLRDRSFDCALLVNAIHLVADAPAALRSMRRVMREGPLLLTAFTKENFASLFVFEYFGLADEIASRLSNAQVEAVLAHAGFVKVLSQPYAYTEIDDGSLNALHIDARALADPSRLRNTSFWHRLDDETRRRGIEALRRDLDSGALEARVRENGEQARTHGHGTLFAGWP